MKYFSTYMYTKHWFVPAETTYFDMGILSPFDGWYDQKRPI